jgi:hypothetical protein
MNVSIIIIVILIIILISILYIYYYSNKNNLNSYLDLSKPQPSIPSSNLVGETSNTYSYSFWLFINIPDPTPTTGANKYFITRPTEISIGFGKDLYVKCLDVNTASRSNIVVYNDVPSQKWIHVIINRSPRLLECYINGKLNMSINTDVSTPISKNSIILDIANAYISKFQRWENPITPAEASNMYYNGNGYSVILPNINVVASVLENDVVQKQYSIF